MVTVDSKGLAPSTSYEWLLWLGGEGGGSSCATLNLVAFNNQLYSQKILITDIKSIQICFISYKLKYKLQKIIELHNYLHLNFKIVYR